MPRQRDQLSPARRCLGWHKAGIRVDKAHLMSKAVPASERQSLRSRGAASWRGAHPGACNGSLLSLASRSSSRLHRRQYLSSLSLSLKYGQVTEGEVATAPSAGGCGKRLGDNERASFSSCERENSRWAPVWVQCPWAGPMGTCHHRAWAVLHGVGNEARPDGHRLTMLRATNSVRWPL